VVRLGLGLCLFYAAVKAFVRFWLFRPVNSRPAPVRNNEVLRFLDLSAMLALIAIFFLLANQVSILKAAASVVALLIYDGIVRRGFLELETRRLCAKSANWSYRAALRHVRRRAQTPMFH
jgi:hypothetical protein